MRAQVGACILGCTLAALLGAAVTILVNNHRAAEAWQARVSALQGQVCKAYEELYVRGDRPQHALYSQVCSTPAGPCGERTADMVQPPNTDFSASCRRDVACRRLTPPAAVSGRSASCDAFAIPSGAQFAVMRTD